MFATFLEFYVHVFVVLLPALFLGLIAHGTTRAGLGQLHLIGVLALMGAGFALWFALAFQLARANLLMPPPTLADPPFVLMLMLGGSVTLWLLAHFTGLGRRISDAIDPALLIGFQIPRVMGAVFVLGWALGEIPWQFALPAGLGDIWAGIAGYRAMRAMQRGDAHADRQIRRANIIGLADFAVAVSTGLITSEGFLHLLSKDAPNIINAYPLALFPGFFVAIFLAAHFVSLSRLRADGRSVLARA